MKSQTWNSFTPLVSEVNDFIGGLRAWNESQDVDGNAHVLWSDKADSLPEARSTSSWFGAISYELRISNSHSGWHHSITFVDATSSPARSVSGIVKRNCQPGVYQMLLPFFYPLQKSSDPLGFFNSWEHSCLADEYSGESINTPGDILDNFIVRPYVMNPTTGLIQALWDTGQTYRGKHNLPGIPISYAPTATNPY